MTSFAPFWVNFSSKNCFDLKYWDKICEWILTAISKTRAFILKYFSSNDKRDVEQFGQFWHSISFPLQISLHHADCCIMPKSTGTPVTQLRPLPRKLTLAAKQKEPRGSKNAMHEVCSYSQIVSSSLVFPRPPPAVQR